MDSVIFEDGILTGPDKTGLLLRLNSQARADKDFFGLVAGLQKEEFERTLKLFSNMVPMMRIAFSV